MEGNDNSLGLVYRYINSENMKTASELCNELLGYIDNQARILFEQEPINDETVGKMKALKQMRCMISDHLDYARKKSDYWIQDISEDAKFRMHAYFRGFDDIMAGKVTDYQN